MAAPGCSLLAAQVEERPASHTDQAQEIALAALAAVDNAVAAAVEAAAGTGTRDSYGLYYTYAYFWCKGWNVYR